jgi:hypothetical protein
MGTWAIVDGTGKVVGVLLGDQSPIAKADASIVMIPEIESGLVVSLYNSGQTVEIDKEDIKANGVVVGRMSK